ncbi:uncharacterized protein TNCV_2471811 [Trichonephila clavipes]|nr:uncharacterized protein TNCV_2471811 [Trichonephila clavipes]
MSTDSWPKKEAKKCLTDKSLELKISPRRKSLDAELYGLGKTLRHLQPPGGPENGIFDAFRRPYMPSPRRKVNNYTQSFVFSSPEVSPARPVTPFKETTHYKLFVMSPPPVRSSKNNWTHSTVFDFNSASKTKISNFIKKNPITGEACPSRDPELRLKVLKKRNPITFEGVYERIIPSRCKQPPGGRASIVLDYHE